MKIVILVTACLISLLNGFIVPASPSATYDVGVTYNYQYVTTVALNEPDTSRAKNVTFQVKADVAVSSVWHNPIIPTENILRLHVRIFFY